MAISAVGKDSNPVREVRIEFGQREHDPVTVCRIDDDVELHLRSSEFLAQRCSRSSQKLDDRDAVVRDGCPLFVGNCQMLAGERLEVGLAQD